MTSSLLQTIKYLTQSDNPAALDLVRLLLDNPDWEIRQLAFTALYLKRTPELNLELYTRFLQEEDAWLRTPCINADRLSKIVSEVFASQDDKLMVLAAKTILKHKLYETLPVVLSYIDSARDDWAKRSAHTILSLAELFFEDLKACKSEVERKNLDRRREWLTSQFEIAVRGYGTHSMDEVLTAFLMVAKKEYPAFTAILADIHSKASKRIVELLEISDHPSLMRLLLSYVDDHDSPPLIDLILAKKTEPRFIRNLLSIIGPSPPSPDAKNSLKRFKYFTWMSVENPELLRLIADNESAFVQLFTCMTLTKEQVAAFFRFTFAHCQAEARRVAVENLRGFPTEEFTQILVEATADSDPIVCATSMRMIKSRSVKDADNYIMRNVDRPDKEILRAIYELMPDFHIESYLQKLDQLPEPHARAIGRVVRKVDLSIEKTLGLELGSYVPLRRSAAATAIRFTGLAKDFQTQLIKVLEKDEETNVRIAACMALSESVTMEAIKALREAMEDKTFTIRNAAGTAVQKWMELYQSQKSGG